MATHDLKFSFKGQLVEATITYSSKDYDIQIYKPVEAKLKGKHIMAMLPAVYVIERKSDSLPNEVPLMERCKKEICHFLSAE